MKLLFIKKLNKFVEFIAKRFNESVACNWNDQLDNRFEIQFVIRLRYKYFNNQQLENKGQDLDKVVNKALGLKLENRDHSSK